MFPHRPTAFKKDIIPSTLAFFKQVFHIACAIEYFPCRGQNNVFSENVFYCVYSLACIRHGGASFLSK